jgi:hypothetical protein
MVPEVVTDAEMSQQKSWIKPLSQTALPTNLTPSPPWYISQGTADRTGGGGVNSTSKLGFSAKKRRPRQKNPGPPGLGLSVNQQSDFIKTKSQ